MTLPLPSALPDCYGESSVRLDLSKYLDLSKFPGMGRRALVLEHVITG